MSSPSSDRRLATLAGTVALIFGAGAGWGVARAESRNVRGDLNKKAEISDVRELNDKLDRLLENDRTHAERFREICVAVRAGCR